MIVNLINYNSDINLCYKYCEIILTQTKMKNSREVILTGQLCEKHILIYFSDFESSRKKLEMKEPGCGQVPGCKLSKTLPRRPQDVLKTSPKNIFIS